MKPAFGLLAFLNWNHDWNNWHFPEELIPKAAAQIRELGVEMVRTDIVWADIHAGDNLYDFKRYDRLLSQLAEYGLNLLVVLHYNKHRLDEQGREIWNRPPESIDEFTRYVEATVRRYKHYVHAWEIWNEPNHPAYWNVPPDEMKLYCRLLSASYHAAKNVDPACMVINGGITGDIGRDVGHFYANGGGDVTDKLNIHTFFHPTQADSLHLFHRTLEAVQLTMRNHGDAAKRIWITEMGCPGLIDPKTVKPWWIGENTTELEQADWVEKIYTLAKQHPAIEKIFWAFYRDTGKVFEDGVDYFGLVSNDLTPKPAFYRLQKLLHQK